MPLAIAYWIDSEELGFFSSAYRGTHIFDQQGSATTT
jgi:hypothetical protein